MKNMFKVDIGLTFFYHMTLFKVNPFHATCLILYPLKTLETSVFLMFLGGIKRAVA